MTDNLLARDSFKAISKNHPCFSEKAHQFFARVHLPVAPKCNIQCNYCNRKYDCVNESRPGVTSELLSPQDALKKVVAIASERRDLSVVGIAGPGDPLANPEKTFETFRLIRKVFPDLLFCLSTNGLNLDKHIDSIVELGIDHVTITVNTMNPDTARKMYAWINIDGVRGKSREFMEEFLERQQKGIRDLIEKGVMVKVNSILMPGINDKELEGLAKRLKLSGVAIHNIVPLIAKAEHGTVFGKQERPCPNYEQLEEVRNKCGVIKQMAHCRQCRADAVGKLGETDRNTGNNRLTAVELAEADFGLSKRENWRQLVDRIISHQALIGTSALNSKSSTNTTHKIAVCTTGSGFVDLGFSEAKELYIYQVVKGKPSLLNVRKIEADESYTEIKKNAEAIMGCSGIISNKFGYETFKEFELGGITPFPDLADMPVEQAVLEAVARIPKTGCKSTTRRKSCGMGC